MREDLIQPDPLLDCLVEICRLHGRPATRASLASGLPVDPAVGLPLDLFERAAARAGLASRVQRLAIERIEPALLPAVLVFTGRRAAVLVRRDSRSGECVLLLPESGQAEVRLSAQELADRYAGVVVFARPRLLLDSRTPAVRAQPGGEGHWFWGALLAQRLVYRDVLWAALLVNLFALALPVFTMNVYDRVVPNHAVETLWALSIGVALVLLADVWLRRLRSRFVDEAGARIDVRLSSVLMERVLGMRLADRPESVGSFAANLRGFEQVRDLAASGTVTALIDLPFALLFLAVMVWIAPWLAVPVVVAFGLIVLSGWLLQARLHALSESTWRAGAQRNATLVEALTGIETIKSQGAEHRVQSKWEQTNAFLASTQVRMRSLSNSALYSTSGIAQAVSVVIVIIGVYLIADRQLTMGALIAASMLASRALAPAGQIVGLLLQYQGARTALAALEAVMQRPVERSADTRIQRPSLRGDIEFRDVAFSYPGRPDAALDGVSFRIAAGEHVALIGRVGSGKSTVQRLIQGLYSPDRGAVLLDGIDLRQLDPADVRRNLGCVSQDVLLFHGTLRENIAFGVPHADDAAVVAAAEIAGLSDFINRHPRGFGLAVGERGETLSGGQRQAVGIARAVLHEAPILLLDEPTSAMDFSSEGQITQKLQAFSAGRTVVLVTHRTSLLALVDRVIVVDQGRIVADGPRDRILEALQAGKVAKAA